MAAQFTRFRLVSSAYKAQSDSGDVCSGLPCEISRLESFGLSFPLTYLVFLVACFWEDDGIFIVGGSPWWGDCCWAKSQPGDFIVLSYCHHTPLGEPSPNNVGQIRKAMGPTKNYSVSFMLLSSRCANRHQGGPWLLSSWHRVALAELWPAEALGQ